MEEVKDFQNERNTMQEKNILQDASWEMELENAEKNPVGSEAYEAALAESYTARWFQLGWETREQRMEGLKLCRKALKIYQCLAVKDLEKYGKYIEHIYNVLNDHFLAECYKGKEEEIPVLRIMLKAGQSLAVWKPGRSGSFAMDYCELGYLLSLGSREEKEEAEQLYRASIKMWPDLGLGDVLTAQACSDFGHLLDEIGKKEEAGQFCRKALESYQRLEAEYPGKYKEALADIRRLLAKLQNTGTPPRSAKPGADSSITLADR